MATIASDPLTISDEVYYVSAAGFNTIPVPDRTLDMSGEGWEFVKERVEVVGYRRRQVLVVHRENGDEYFVQASLVALTLAMVLRWELLPCIETMWPRNSGTDNPC